VAAFEGSHSYPRGVCVALMASPAVAKFSAVSRNRFRPSGRFLVLWQIGTRGGEFLDKEILKICLLYGETDE
jgi:hypothetical protein